MEYSFIIDILLCGVCMHVTLARAKVNSAHVQTALSEAVYVYVLMSVHRVWAQPWSRRGFFSLILEGNREWEGGCDLHAVARDLS